jgi:hypothetical protein
MALERLDGIHGTARIITACRGKQVAKAHLVATHEQDEQRSHHEELGVAGGEGSGDAVAAAQRSSCMSTRSISVPSWSNAAA